MYRGESECNSVQYLIVYTDSLALRIVILLLSPYIVNGRILIEIIQHNSTLSEYFQNPIGIMFTLC